MKIEEKYKLEKYIKEDGSEVNVYFDIDRQTIWMSQKEMSLIVNKSKSTINEHIKKLYDNEEKYVSEFGFSESWNKEKYFNNDSIKIGIKWQGNTYYDKDKVFPLIYPCHLISQVSFFL